MKRPSLQYYPADHRKDVGIQRCSLAAKGLWHEMICIMHECIPYGHLAINNTPISATDLAKLVGEKRQKIIKLLTELNQNGVYSVTKNGTIFSRRMVKDEHIRNVRILAGTRGNESQGKKIAENLQPLLRTQNNTQKHPPSSSTSSSTTGDLFSNEDYLNNNNINKPKKTKIKKNEFTLPDFVPMEEWEAFVAHRKAVGVPMSLQAMRLAVTELSKLKTLGEDLKAVINQSIMNGWRGLFAVKKNQGTYDRQRPTRSKEQEQFDRGIKCLTDGDEKYLRIPWPDEIKQKVD